MATEDARIRFDGASFDGSMGRSESGLSTGFDASVVGFSRAL
jgi:hypothetical protein